MTIKMRLLGSMILIMILAACGDVEAPPTSIPSATPTRHSTPLPDVATAIPAGFNEENPLRLVIVPNDAEAAAELVDELEAQLTGRTALTLEVELAESKPEALAAVCNSTSGRVTAAWVDGMTLAAAVGQDCGVPAIQIERDDETGSAGVLLFHTETVNENSPADVIAGSTFCRISYTDLFSWIVPTIMLRARGIDIADLSDVVEYETYDEIVEAITSGDCAIAGLPQTVWEDALDDYTPETEDDPTLEEIVATIQTSAEIPYGVLVVPFAASLDVINELTEAMLAVDVLFGEGEPIATPEPEGTQEAEATAEATAEVSDVSDLEGELAVFFGEGVLLRVDISDFGEFSSFLEVSGIDFGAIGE